MGKALSSIAPAPPPSQLEAQLIGSDYGHAPVQLLEAVTVRVPSLLELCPTINSRISTLRPIVCDNHSFIYSLEENRKLINRLVVLTITRHLQPRCCPSLIALKGGPRFSVEFDRRLVATGASASTKLQERFSFH